jgi:predicted ATP-grasp superfamily ATP-dependent carboligase
LNPEESESFEDRFGPRERRGDDVSLEERERMRRQVEAGILAFRAFRIEQTDSTVALHAAEGTNRLYYPDGREVERRIEGLGKVTMKARWRGGKLQVTRTMAEGIELEETYELSEDAERLHVRFRVRGAARAFDFRRVYERVGEAG